jgi:xylose isomerase
MSEHQSYHSICRWTFNAGKGGFVPGDMRPEWGVGFTTMDMVRLVRDRIAPRLPENVVLGLEVHYDNEVSEGTAVEISDALVDAGMYLAMITPGGHGHWAYGGISSLDPNERDAANEFGIRTVDVGYDLMRPAWHHDDDMAPSLVLWNGSFGYDLASIGIRDMYTHLKESVAALCRYEEKKGNKLYMGIEPKPNEGHPAMLLPTVASALLFWRRLAEEYGISPDRKGVNKEFGHSEMIGLDHVYDTVEEIDNGEIVHMHLNSQGYNDGIILGGPGKYDIDHGTRINGMNIAIAGLVNGAGFNRWKGHDMQARAYDNEEQGIDRVIRSVLSWEACDIAARDLDEDALLELLANRETAKAEDMMRHAVHVAQHSFDALYSG